jgi:hypothetical protein
MVMALGNHILVYKTRAGRIPAWLYGLTTALVRPGYLPDADGVEAEQLHRRNRLDCHRPLKRTLA